MVAVDPDKTDGRRVRRERNRQAVIDAVLELFNEETLVPTIELASERSGMSLRSVYRYFPDPESLLQAAIEEMWRRGSAAAHLSRIGQGPFEDRLHGFASMRVRLYEEVGGSFRAAQHHAPHFVRIREGRARTRRALSDQFEQQFRPEVDSLPSSVRLSRTMQADMMSQLDVIDLLRRDRQLTIAETVTVVSDAVCNALRGGP